MKKYLFSLMALLGSFVLSAQEEVSENVVEDYEWSDTSKWVLVGIFALVIITLVLRTFRDKPTM
jgi:uncharacterized membrane protein YdcZ (DUF606 family)